MGRRAVSWIALIIGCGQRGHRPYHSSGDQAGGPSWLGIVHQLRDMVVVVCLVGVAEPRLALAYFFDGGAARKFEM